MIKNIEACDWLTLAIKNLEASNLDPIYVKLRAVCPLSSYHHLFFFLLEVYMIELFLQHSNQLRLTYSLSDKYQYEGRAWCRQSLPSVTGRSRVRAPASAHLCGKGLVLKTTLPQTPHSAGSLRWVRPFLDKYQYAASVPFEGLLATWEDKQIQLRKDHFPQTTKFVSYGRLKVICV